jgi:chemosensory pili system protein ChpA (sensor histidine kinase/response regulator)
MLTIEIAAALILLVGLLIYAIIRAYLERTRAHLPGQAEQAARILVVDDDPDFVKITKRILVNHGHEVQTASSGAEALKTMRGSSVKPDVVLLDIMMDYITDGLDVSNAMQRDPHLKDIPVIMVTSLTGIKSHELFPSDQRVAVSAWLNKPVKPAELLSTVQKALTGVTEGVPVGFAVVS